MSKNFSSGEQEFRSAGYNDIMKNKFALVRKIVDLGYDPFMLDSDVIMLRNPINYLIDMPPCDYYMSMEAVNNSQMLNPSESRWGGIDDHKKSYTAMQLNAGVMLWRSTETSKALLADFARNKYRIRNADDQYEFNQYLARKGAKSVKRIDLNFMEVRESCAKFAGLSVFVLPPCLFGTRPHAYVGKLADQASVSYYLVHFNWGFGVGNKRGGMEDAGLWFSRGDKIIVNAQYNVSGFPEWVQAFVGKVFDTF